MCNDINPADLNRRVSIFSGMAYIENNNLVSFTDNDLKVPKTRLTQSFHVPYASKYSGGFSLLDSYKIPRPCAFKSFNMTQVEYYRGQNPLSYSIA